jgi:hypothetical protein
MVANLGASYKTNPDTSVPFFMSSALPDGGKSGSELLRLDMGGAVGGCSLPSPSTPAAPSLLGPGLQRAGVNNYIYQTRLAISEVSKEKNL